MASIPAHRILVILLCLSQPFRDIRITLSLPAIPDAALVNSETPKSVFIVEEML